MEKTKHSDQAPFNHKIEDYSYELPDDKIAKYPLPKRDESKLLVWSKEEIKDSQFVNLPDFLPSGCLLVFNNTKVIHARLIFLKETGARIEIFCLEPVDPFDYQLAFQSNKTCIWKCMVGNQKKWKDDILRKSIHLDEKEIILEVKQVDRNLIQFSWNNENIEFSKLIEAAGELPIPPYLNRETELNDLKTYQTVYSKIKGSVAAPTAGLHFTEKVFSRLKADGHQLEELTLHVGAGTFQPVKSESIADHEMHAETFYINRNFLNRIISHRNKIIAVGTTSVRTLESIYWLGVQLITNQEKIDKNLAVTQWEAYSENAKPIQSIDALSALIGLMDDLKTDYLTATTKIIIVPGYKFRLVDGILTNFHQPQSTLLLLIAAYLGNNWKKIYRHALENGYRFLSYGDSNLYLND
jgi:S-adenosylmethionine:tRNA ribosyltransferase-isomerase